MSVQAKVPPDARIVTKSRPFETAASHCVVRRSRWIVETARSLTIRGKSSVNEAKTVRTAHYSALCRQPLEHRGGNRLHRRPAVHRSPLDPAECLGLGHLLMQHQQTLGPIDDLARLQPLTDVGDFGPQR